MRRSLTKLAVLCVVGVCVFGAPRTAHAQESQGAASAQVLYEEGRSLVAAGRASEGCAKLAESNRVDPAVGTRFYLADCYERVGRTASAWATFLEVATASKVRGHADRESLARERAATLEPHLSKLTIVVDALAEGEQVRRGDVELGRASWGTPMPVDPGEHVVTAIAKARKPWSGTVTVPDGGSASLRVPALIVLPPDPKATETAGARSSARNVGLGLGALGLVAIGVGTVTGVQALSKNEDSKPLCDGNTCTGAGKSLRDDAISSAWVSNISLAVGGLAVLAGAYLVFFVAPSQKSSTSRASLSIGPSTTTIGGTF